MGANRSLGSLRVVRRHDAEIVIDDDEAARIEHVAAGAAEEHTLEAHAAQCTDCILHASHGDGLDDTLPRPRGEERLRDRHRAMRTTRVTPNELTEQESKRTALAKIDGARTLLLRTT